MGLLVQSNRKNHERSFRTVLSCLFFTVATSPVMVKAFIFPTATAGRIVQQALPSTLSFRLTQVRYPNSNKIIDSCSSLKSTSAFIDENQISSNDENNSDNGENNKSKKRKRQSRRIRDVIITPNPYNIPSDTEQRWTMFYTFLLEHYLQHGNTENIEVGPKINQSLLRNWMAEQRLSYMQLLDILPDYNTVGARKRKISPLSMEKKELLDRAGFHWGPFADMEPKYVNRNGKSSITATSISTSTLKRTNLLHNKQDDSFHSSKWTSMFHQLLKFFEEQKHSHIPQIFPENPALGKWVYRQRHSKHHLSERRKQMLNQLNFHWLDVPTTTNSDTKIKKRKKTWKQYYADLVHFQKQYGHLNVPSTYSKNPKLRSWIKHQRKRYQLLKTGDENTRMNERRIQALEKIGFDWEKEEHQNDGST